MEWERYSRSDRDRRAGLRCNRWADTRTERQQVHLSAVDVAAPKLDRQIVLPVGIDRQGKSQALACVRVVDSAADRLAICLSQRPRARDRHLFGGEAGLEIMRGLGSQIAEFEAINGVRTAEHLAIPGARKTAGFFQRPGLWRRFRIWVSTLTDCNGHDLVQGLGFCNIVMRFPTAIFSTAVKPQHDGLKCGRQGVLPQIMT